MTDTLEEVSYHYLRTYQWEHRYYDSTCMSGYACQFLARPEYRDDILRNKFAYQCGKAGDAGGYPYGIAKHTPYAVVLVRSPVVSGYGLHALVEPHDDHDKHRRDG